jgi:hypothetical protein
MGRNNDTQRRYNARHWIQHSTLIFLKQKLQEVRVDDVAVE